MASWTVLGKAGCATARVNLRRGARVKAEPDAVITMSEHVELGASMDGGFVGGMLRSAFTNESLFSQTLLARGGDADVVLGAPEVGDVELIRLEPGSPYLITKGAFLASDDSITISTATQRNVLGAFTSGAGLFVLHAEGRGTLAVNAHGSILAFDLAAGETRAVDNGHLIAWSAAMPYEMRLAGGARGGGLLSSMYTSTASGEGLMCFFTGPGRLLLQSHKPPDAREEPGQRRKRGGGGSGNGGANTVANYCCCCLVFLVVAAALICAFVVVPAFGGRWVQTAPGKFDLVWEDAFSSPSIRASSRDSGGRRLSSAGSTSRRYSESYRASTGTRGPAVHYEDEL